MADRPVSLVNACFFQDFFFRFLCFLTNLQERKREREFLGNALTALMTRIDIYLSNFNQCLSLSLMAFFFPFSNKPSEVEYTVFMGLVYVPFTLKIFLFGS